MRKLAHILLHTSGNEGFSSGERELIASFVSSRNACYFCQTSHGPAAARLQEGGGKVVKAVCRDYRSAPISNKAETLESPLQYTISDDVLQPAAWTLPDYGLFRATTQPAINVRPGSFVRAAARHYADVPTRDSEDFLVAASHLGQNRLGLAWRGNVIALGDDSE